MILPIPSASPAWVHVLAGTVLVLHIAGGAIGLVSGTVALLVRKGGRWHRWAGHTFFVSMTTMAVIGAVIEPMLHKRLDSLVGWFTLYLVGSAWVTLRRAPGTVGRFEIAAYALVMTIVATCLTFALMAANAPTQTLDGETATAYLVLAAIVAPAVWSDRRLLAHGGVSGAPRIARHVWRMGFALTIAAASFFLGQQQVLPKIMQGSPLLAAPELAVLGTMVFWLLRLRRRARRDEMSLRLD